VGIVGLRSNVDSATASSPYFGPMKWCARAAAPTVVSTPRARVTGPAPQYVVSAISRLVCLILGLGLQSGWGEPAEELGRPRVPAAVFTCSPLALEGIQGITPLGNMDPLGGHVLPTDHIYLNHGNHTNQLVLAPADGEVYAVREQRFGGAKIEIRFDPHISFYLAHVLVDPGLRVGSRVKAGQVLGHPAADTQLDLGATDSRIRLAGFVNPTRYPPPMLQAISPLALFAEPLRSQLYAKVKREGADKDGRIDFDQPGRLVGNWFQEGLLEKDSLGGRPEVAAKQLAFAYDVSRPSEARFAIGGGFAPAGLYTPLPGGPDPASVSVSSGLVKYELRKAGGQPSAAGPSGPGRSSARVGVLLVQLVDEQTLKAEFFADGSPGEIAGFTGQAIVYKR
jgi:hypothetical protein